MTAAPQLDLAAVKARQQATWASGDFAEIATLIVPVAENLVDTLEAVGSRRDAPERDLEALALAWNRLDQPGPIAVPAMYLESVGVRR